MGLAYAVDRQAYNQLMTAEARNFFGDPEMMCFGECFNGAIERARSEFPNEIQMALHFDRGRRSTRLDAIVGIVDANYRGVPDIKSVGFDKVVDFPPLQAADVLATENRWDAMAFIANEERRPHFRHFLQNCNTAGYFLDYSYMKHTLEAHGFSLAS